MATCSARIAPRFWRRISTACRSRVLPRMINEEYRGAKQWSRDKQAVFTVVWISFLSAAVGTMVFFAIFDPVELGASSTKNANISRDAGYAIGFFFFWVLCAICSGVNRISGSHRPETRRASTDSNEQATSRLDV